MRTRNLSAVVDMMEHLPVLRLAATAKLLPEAEGVHGLP